MTRESILYAAEVCSEDKGCSHCPYYCEYISDLGECMADLIGRLKKIIEEET